MLDDNTKCGFERMNDELKKQAEIQALGLVAFFVVAVRYV